jgi:prepilin-type processing-associated H-X9-DG protein
MFVGPTAFSNGPNGRKYEEITDGLANTVAVVEMSPSGILWTAPYDLNVSEMSFEINDPDRPGLRSCHSGCANVLFVDGYTQFFGTPGATTDAEERRKAQVESLKAMATINGGEDVSRFSQ